MAVRLTINNEQGGPVSNLPVKVTACDSTFMQKTNDEGSMVFRIYSPACTRLQVRVSSRFYEPLDTLLDCPTPAASHVIQLCPKTQKIRQVEVVAFRRIAQNDAQKSVYTIDTRSMLKTTKADRAISFLPGIETRGGSYALLGQSRQARIMIDGKPASTDELKTINAKDIERIEVREQTKDDDSGSAGEINIVKRRQEHPKIYAYLSGWTGILRQQVGTYDNFGYQDSKWDITGYVNLLRHTQKQQTHVDRYFADTSLPAQHLSLDRTVKTTQDAERVKVSYQPSTLLTITAAAYHSGYPCRASEDGTDFDRTPYQRNSDEHIDHYGGYANVGYRTGKEQTLTLKTNYYYYRYAIDYPGSDIDRYRSAMREYTGELVWEAHTPLLGKTHDISAGLKNIYRQNMVSSALGTRTCYSIQQAYLTDFMPITKSLSANIILKGETDNQRQQRHYYFLPSLRLNYNLPRRASLAASYQRRITRPSVDYINADTLFINDYTLRVGNAALDAQHNDSYSLSWRKQIRNAYLTLTANYEHEGNVISDIYATAGDYDVTTYANIGSSDYAGMSANYTQRLLRNRMNVSLSLTGFYKAYHIDQGQQVHTWAIPSEGWGWRANLNMSYLTSRGWMYTLSSSYSPKSYSLNGIYHRNPQLFFTISKNLFKDRMELEVNCLNSLVYLWGSRSDTYFRNMHQAMTRRLHANNITITLAWNIGRQFRSRRVASGISNDDIVTKKGE